MNWLDMAIVAVVAVLGLYGLWKGLIRIIFPILGLIAGLILGGRYGEAVAEKIFASPQGWQLAGGFGLVLVATLVVATLVASILRKILKLLMLGWLDRLAGLFAGVAIGVLLWALLLGLAAKFPFLQGFIDNSSLASFIVEKISISPESFIH